MLPDHLLTDYAAPDAPGAAVMVIRDGGAVTLRTAGAARLDEPTPVDARTAFRLASLTKQLTAKAVAELVDRRLLSLDTRIRDLVPGLPEWAEAILVGHLVAHTSGLPPYESLVTDGPAGPAGQLSDRDVVSLLATAPAPRFPPGSRFEYDNGGYALLAVALEEVSGRTFTALLDELIFVPLGMEGAVAHVEGRTTVRNRALGYRKDENGWADADQGITTAVLGDGGVYASLDDLAHWDGGLRRPGYEPDADALNPYQAPVARDIAYGWGWFLDTFEGRRRQRHEGWTTGFQNEIQRFPDDGLTVVVLTNRADPPVRALAEAIARTS